MNTMNGFESVIVKKYGDGPDAVASCPAGHQIWECQIEQWDHTSDRWWVAAPVGTEYRGWTNESSMWEEFAEAGVYVWDYCEQTDRYAWIDPSTRAPYQGEVRGPC